MSISGIYTFGDDGDNGDVDDVGIFFLNEIIPHQSASAHFVFWDKRFRGREELCKEMLRYVFEQYKFERIQVEVPLYAYHTMDAVENLGFVLEGRIRRAILYHDKWFDVNLYSVLPSDLDRTTKLNRIKRYSVCFKCGTLTKRMSKKLLQKQAEEAQDART